MNALEQPNKIIKTGKIQQEWRSRLEQVQQETDYFLDVLNDLKSRTIGDSHKSLLVAQFVQDFHHFERLTKRMLEELNLIRHEIAEELQSLQRIEPESIKDQNYFKAEMKDFEKNYKEAKYKFRSFVAGFEHLSS